MQTAEISKNEPAKKDAAPVVRLAFSIPETAESIGCSVPHVWRLIAKGKLRSTKAGRRTIVPASALRAFVEGEAA